MLRTVVPLLGCSLIEYFRGPIKLLVKDFALIPSKTYLAINNAHKYFPIQMAHH